MRRLLCYFVTCALSITLLLPGLSAAQSLNYIDESGNIHFVDGINQVPMQYRNQFVSAQKTLEPGSRAAKDYERKIKAREREIERAKKKKEKEEAKKKKAEEKERKRKEKEKAREEKKKKKEKK